MTSLETHRQTQAHEVIGFIVGRGSVQVIELDSTLRQDAICDPVTDTQIQAIGAAIPTHAMATA